MYYLYLDWTMTFQCWQGRHFPPEAVRGASDLVCQVPCSQCRTRGCSLLVERSRASAGGEPLDDPEAKEPNSGPASRAVAGPPERGRRALWCLINEWLLRIHRVVGQSLVLAALKQHAMKQQAAKQQQPAFRSGRTEKYWHILNNFEQF